jgi:hypothetical protein
LNQKFDRRFLICREDDHEDGRWMWTVRNTLTAIPMQ